MNTVTWVLVGLSALSILPFWAIQVLNFVSNRIDRRHPLPSDLENQRHD